MGCVLNIYLLKLNIIATLFHMLGAVKIHSAMFICDIYYYIQCGLVYD